MPTYYAVLEDNKTVINSNSLDYIKSLKEPMNLLIKQEYDRNQVVHATDAECFTYSSVNIKGEHQPIDLDKFTFVHLGTDSPTRYGYIRKYVVKEKSSGIIREFETAESGSAYLINEIIRMISTLNSAGSWEAFDKFQELEKVNEENKRVKEENQVLRERIKLLEKEAGLHTSQL